MCMCEGSGIPPATKGLSGLSPGFLRREAALAPPQGGGGCKELLMGGEDSQRGSGMSRGVCKALLELHEHKEISRQRSAGQLTSPHHKPIFLNYSSVSDSTETRKYGSL